MRNVGKTADEALLIGRERGYFLQELIGTGWCFLLKEDDCRNVAGSMAEQKEGVRQAIKVLGLNLW